MQDLRFSQRWRESGLLRLILQLIVVLAIALVAYGAVQQEQRADAWFDPLDESAHYDYVVKLSDAHIPAWGSTLDQGTMRIWSCLGNSVTRVVTGDCAVMDRSPSSFAAGGFNYEAQQPPIGYLAYVPGYLMTSDLAPAQALDTVRDVGGTLLLIIAATLIVVIANRTRLGPIRTAIFAGLTLLAPISIHAFAIVSNDASTLVAALGFLLGFIVVRKRARGPVVIILSVVVGVLLGGVKGYLLLLPLGAFVALALLEYGRGTDRYFSRAAVRRFARRGDVVYVVIGTAVSGLVAVGFTVLQKVREIIPASIVQDALGGSMPRVSFVQWRTIVSSFVNLTNSWFGGPNGLSSSGQLFVAINTLFLIGVGVAFARRSMWFSGTRDFAASWLSTVVIFSVGWSVLQLLQGGFNFDAPPRYGLPLLPLATLAVALAMTWKGGINRHPDLPELGNRAGLAVGESGGK